MKNVSDTLIYAFDEDLSGKKVVIYGASETGGEIFCQLEAKNPGTVILAIDQDADNTLWNYSVCVSPQDFFEGKYDYDFIIICTSSDEGKRNIRKRLIDHHVPLCNILDFHFASHICIGNHQFSMVYDEQSFVQSLLDLHRCTVDNVELFWLCVKWVRGYWEQMDLCRKYKILLRVRKVFADDVQLYNRIAAGVFLFECGYLKPQQVAIMISYVVKLEDNPEYMYNLGVYFGWMEHRQKKILYDGLGRARNRLWSLVMEHYYSDHMMEEVEQRDNYDRNRIAIVTNYLMGARESVGILQRGFAKALHNQKKEVCIFVLMYKQMGIAELSVRGRNAYYNTMLEKEWNCRCLGDAIRVEYIYENTSREMIYKAEHLINAFRPACVIDGTDDICPISWVLHKHYPIFYLSSRQCTSAMWFDKTDMGIFDFNKENSDKAVVLPAGKPQLFSSVQYTKEQYLGVEETAFIVVTVGVRLADELNEELLDYMMEAIQERPAIHWLLVGASKDGIWNKEKYDKIRDHIHLITYEKNLASLYRICDVYMQPDRMGGGYSIAIAMQYGVAMAILANNQATGGGAWARQCAGVQGGYKELVDYVIKLYDNPQECDKQKKKSEQEYRNLPEYEDAARVLANVIDDMMNERYGMES